MATRGPASAINPLLGAYFAVFTSALIALVVLLLIFDQLGVSPDRLRLVMIAGAITLYLVIAAIAYTSSRREFTLSGRRVPSFFNGLLLWVTALGGTGLTGLAGVFLISGFDALCLGLGIVAGLVAMLALIAPYFRKLGAPTMPGYLGRRFESQTVRITAATITVAPLLLLLIAELKIAQASMMTFVDLPPLWTAFCLIGLVVALVAPGGSRSISWAGAAQGITALIALLVPIAIVAVMVTNLPLAQFSHGPVLRQLTRIEPSLIPVPPVASPLSLQLPGLDFHPLAAPYVMPFANIGPVAFVLMTFILLGGIASQPGLLTRVTTAPTVYESRKSIGWAVFLAGITIMTMSSIAVFTRDVLVDLMTSAEPGKLPPAIGRAIDYGLVTVSDGGAKGLSALQFRRDGSMQLLPVLIGLPALVGSLISLGLLAAALAAASVNLGQLSLILAEDVLDAGGRPRDGRFGGPLALARGAIVIVAAGAGGLAYALPGDPLELLLWSLSLSGAALFPVLVLSIWWKRITPFGATAGMVTGFAVAALLLMANKMTALGGHGLLASAIAGPAALAVAVVASLMSREPGRQLLEIVRDVRVPGGESLYDREMRLRGR